MNRGRGGVRLLVHRCRRGGVRLLVHGRRRSGLVMLLGRRGYRRRDGEAVAMRLVPRAGTGVVLRVIGVLLAVAVAVVVAVAVAVVVVVVVLAVRVVVLRMAVSGRLI